MCACVWSVCVHVCVCVCVCVCVWCVCVYVCGVHVCVCYHVKHKQSCLMTLATKPSATQSLIMDASWDVPTCTFLWAALWSGHCVCTAAAVCTQCSPAAPRQAVYFHSQGQMVDQLSATPGARDISSCCVIMLLTTTATEWPWGWLICLMIFKPVHQSSPLVQSSDCRLPSDPARLMVP